MTVTLTIELDGNDVLTRVERDVIAQALKLAGGNISAAADLLGIFRQSLQRKMVKLGIAPPATQPATPP